MQIPPQLQTFTSSMCVRIPMLHAPISHLIGFIHHWRVISGSVDRNVHHSGSQAWTKYNAYSIHRIDIKAHSCLSPIIGGNNQSTLTEWIIPSSGEDFIINNTSALSAKEIWCLYHIIGVRTGIRGLARSKCSQLMYKKKIQRTIGELEMF